MKNMGKWLVAIYFASVPFDISKVLFPPYESTPSSPTTLTFVRISTILLVAYTLIYLLQRRDKIKALLPSASSLLVLIPVVTAAVLSYIGSVNLHTSIVETLRLLTLIAVGFSISIVIESVETLERVWKITFLMATLTAIFGIFQYLTGIGIWGGGSIYIAGNGLRRINSTFMDYNMFARYLNISILSTLYLMLKKEWSIRGSILVGLFLQVIALYFTFSRAGWLILGLGILLLALTTPSSIRTRFFLACTVAVGVLAAIPGVRLRILSLVNGELAVVERQQLMKAGLAMFSDHPLTGVGIGNFQFSLENKYKYFIPWENSATRPHTSLISIGSEMGAFGYLALLCFAFGLFNCLSKVRIYFKTHAYTALVGILVIFLSSQTEGRLLEDPLLWGFWGLIMACEKLSRTSL